MSTTPAPAVPPTPPGPPQNHPMRRFLNFWFAPADPTILGFIRIVAGCLVLYTHAAYSPDLTNFFGKDAWYDLATIDRERKELPQVATPLEWDDPLRPFRGAQLPEYPHRRQVVAGYVRGVTGAGPAATAAAVAYLDPFLKADEQTLKQFAAPGQFTREGLAFIDNLHPDPRDRAGQMTVLVDEAKRKEVAESRLPPLPLTATPAVVVNMTPADKEKVARDAEAFYAALPAKDLDRSYVVTHWAEMDHQQRLAFAAFLKRVAAAPPEERDRQLDYLEYWNVDPAIVTRFGSPTFSIWYHVTDPTEMRIAHAAMLGVFALFTLGVFTRVTAVLTWLAVASYLHRTMHILFGMDTMMNIVLIYLMVGDCGAALSVDRLVRRYRAARRSIDRHGTLDPATRAYLAGPPASVAAGFALRLIQVHFCFIYMASGMSKLKGNSWWNTTAYWDTLANPEFTAIYYRWYEGGLRAVVSSRPAYAVMAAVGVGFTFVAELGMPIVMWTRLRPFAVMAALCLHTGIALFMGLVVFSLFMMTLLLAYLPGVAVRAVLFGGEAPAERVRVRFSPAAAAQRRGAAVVAAFDLDGRVDFLAAPTDAGSLTIDDGRPATAGAIAGRVPTLKTLRFLLAIPAVGRLVTGAARP